MLEVRESDVKAGGGSSKDMWEATKAEPSRLLRSVDEAGVGGRVGRGILRDISAQDAWRQELSQGSWSRAREGDEMRCR